MDNKITKTRLKQLLSYDLLKIVAIIAAAVLFWSLMFTMFGAGLSEGQSLNVYAYNVTVSESEMNKLLGGEYGKFVSYDVHKTSFYNFGNYSPNDTTFPQQFTAWSSVGQLDIFFVSNGNDKEVTSEKQEGEGETEKVYSGLFEDYVYYYYDLNEFVDDAIKYCKKFGGYNDDGTYNRGKIEEYFRLRKKRDNFYRHKLISADQEVERFELIWQNAQKLKGWLEDSQLDIWAKAEIENSKTKEKENHIVGIDMGKLGNYQGENSPASLCHCGETNGETGSTVADGVIMTVFNNASKQSDLVYESLAFVIKVVEVYSGL